MTTQRISLSRQLTFEHAGVDKRVGVWVLLDEKLGYSLAHDGGAVRQVAVAIHGILVAGDRQRHLAGVDRAVGDEGDLGRATTKLHQPETLVGRPASLHNILAFILTMATIYSALQKLLNKIKYFLTISKMC